MTLTASATQILAVAERLFAQRGFDGVSMQQIADDAGISKANIYHHFKSKDALYLAVLKYALLDMKELFAELQGVDDSSAEQLAHFSAEHLKHLNANSRITRLMLREMLDGGSSRCQDLAEQVFAECFYMLRSLLSRCQERGDVRRDIDPDHMASALVGMNVFLFQTWPALQHFPGNIFKNQQESGKVMFELLCNGFTAQGDKK